MNVLDLFPPPREGRIPCPRRAVMWGWSCIARIGIDQGTAFVPCWRTALLVKRMDGGTSYCADLDQDTPYFLEVREGNPPNPGEGDLGLLLCRLDLDGEAMIDRLDAEPVLYGEAPDEVLLVAELSLEAGAWTVERVRP